MPTEVWHTLWYEHALQSEQVFDESYVPFKAATCTMSSMTSAAQDQLI